MDEVGRFILRFILASFNVGTRFAVTHLHSNSVINPRNGWSWCSSDSGGSARQTQVFPPRRKCLPMKRVPFILAALALLLIGGRQAKADPVLYDNGPINGTVTARTINFSWSVSDSFTLSSASTLTGVQIGLWVAAGGVPSSVAWSIGTAPFTSDLGSGLRAVLNLILAGSGELSNWGRLP